jgi:hypothetical protein
MDGWIDSTVQRRVVLLRPLQNLTHPPCLWQFVKMRLNKSDVSDGILFMSILTEKKLSLGGCNIYLRN